MIIFFHFLSFAKQFTTFLPNKKNQDICQMKNPRFFLSKIQDFFNHKFRIFLSKILRFFLSKKSRFFYQKIIFFSLVPRKIHNFFQISKSSQ